jgi:hypothetical protein
MNPKEIERQQAVASETTALQSAFKKFHESGIKYTGTDADVLANFKASGHEIFVEDGVALTKFDSEILPLYEALVRHAFDAPQGEVDRRTLPRAGAAGGRSGVTSKADLKTMKEKVDYVNKFGEAAFLALPLTGQVTSEIRTQADFRKLPLSEKVRLTNTDPDYVAKFKPSPGTRMPGQPFVDQIKLDRIAAIRPASRKR